MTKKAYLGLFVLIIFACSKKISSNQVMGSWWSIEADLTYSESYINEDEWVYNHQSFGPIHYKYHLENDNLFVFNNLDSKKKWEILYCSDSQLVIKSDSVQMTLNKLKIRKNYFDTFKDSVEFDLFQQEFISRYLEKF